MAKIRLVGLIVLLLGLGAGPGSVAAQTADGLRMTVKPGIDGYYRVGNWFPVQVTLENSGPSLKGRLWLEGDSYAANYIAVDLPSQARQSYTLYTASSRINSTAVLRFAEGDKVYAEQPLTLKYQQDPSFIIGVVGGDSTALSTLTGATFGYISSSQTTQQGVQSTIIHPKLDELPANALALATLDVLVIADGDTAKLSAGQVAAVRSWLAAGGDLVIGGGRNARANAAAFGDLLPLEVGEPRSIDGLAPLGTYITATTAPPAEQVVVSSGPLKQGSTLVAISPDQAQSSQPLIAQREYGRGRLLYFAFDPTLSTLRGWDDYPRLWQLLLANHRSGPDSAALAHTNQGGNFGFALPQFDLPNPGLLAILLFAYVMVIGPLNFIILGRLRRRELSWLTIPACVVAFGLLFFLIGYQTKGSTILLNRASVTFGQVEGNEALISSIVSIFSPNRTSYDLRLGNGLAVADSNGSFGSAGGGLHLGTPNRFERLNIGNWAQGNISVQEAASLAPQFAVSSLPSSSNLRLTLKNVGDRPYRDIVLFEADHRSDRFDLAPGESKEVSLNQVPGGNEEFVRYLAHTGESIARYTGYSYSNSQLTKEERTDGLRYQMAQTTLTNRDFGSYNEATFAPIYLTAWSDKARGSSELEQGGARTDSSFDLYTTRLGRVRP